MYQPDKSVFVFARDHERLIVTQAMLPIYMELGSELVLYGKSENTLLLTLYRGSNIMASLYEYAVEHCIDRGIQFIWGFTHAVKALKKFGFTHYRVIEVLVRPSNIWIDIVSRLKS